MMLERKNSKQRVKVKVHRGRRGKKLFVCERVVLKPAWQEA